MTKLLSSCSIFKKITRLIVMKSRIYRNIYVVKSHVFIYHVYVLKTNCFYEENLYTKLLDFKICIKTIPYPPLC